MKYLKENHQSVENLNLHEKILKLVQITNPNNKLNDEQGIQESLNNFTEGKLDKKFESIILQIPLNESYLDKLIFKRKNQKSPINPHKKAKSFRFNVKI
jgi:hypothetical protein